MLGGGPGLIFCRERTTGKVDDRRPSPNVLAVSTKLLEAEAAVWSPKFVDASVPFGGLWWVRTPSKICRGVRTLSNDIRPAVYPTEIEVSPNASARGRVIWPPVDSRSMLPRPAVAAEFHCAQDGIQLREGAPRSGLSPPSDPRPANQKRGHPHRDVKRTRGRLGQNRPSRTSRTNDSLTTPVPLGSPNNGTSVLFLNPPLPHPERTPLLLTGSGHRHVRGSHDRTIVTFSS